MESGDAFDLPLDEAHHVFKVLRARSGDVFEVVDAGERLFLAELRGGRETVVVEELAVQEENGARIILYQAVPKGRHMDLVVEKATEIGVNRIIPLVTDRGVVRLEEGTGKAERWRRVAEAAARQSLRLRVPEVGGPVSFPEAVREAGEGVVLHNGDGLPRLEEVMKLETVSLFVGPEGGWSEGELAIAEETGLVLAQLGPYRLRSETAGVVAVARAWAALETVVEHT